MKILRWGVPLSQVAASSPVIALCFFVFQLQAISPGCSPTSVLGAHSRSKPLRRAETQSFLLFGNHVHRVLEAIRLSKADLLNLVVHPVWTSFSQVPKRLTMVDPCLLRGPLGRCDNLPGQTFSPSPSQVSSTPCCEVPGQPSGCRFLVGPWTLVILRVGYQFGEVPYGCLIILSGTRGRHSDSLPDKAGTCSRTSLARFGWYSRVPFSHSELDFCFLERPLS